jgi:hypothetical protein
MALALVGGMAVSTFLTLFVVPCAYSVIDDVMVWNQERRKQGVSLIPALRALRNGGGNGRAPVSPESAVR